MAVANAYGCKCPDEARGIIKHDMYMVFCNAEVVASSLIKDSAQVAPVVRRGAGVYNWYARVLACLEYYKLVYWYKWDPIKTEQIEF